MQKKKFPVRTLCQAALLVAAEIVLNRFCSINTMGLKIGFSFVPMALCAILFGPWWGAACYALSDLLGAVLFPIGPYHPGFSICAGLMGLSYGIFLYEKGKVRGPEWLKALCPALINTLVLGLCVNTLWVAQLYGSRTYWGWFVYRLPEYAVLIPLNLVFLPILKKLSQRLRQAGLV